MLSGMDAGASPFCALPEGMGEMQKKHIWEMARMELSLGSVPVIRFLKVRAACPH